jgi:putative ATPase
LLSRVQVFTLQQLGEEELMEIMRRALADNERGLGRYKVEIDPSVIKLLATLADGDARAALNALELAVMTTAPTEAGVRTITPEAAQEAMQKRILYDKAGEEHYNLISALHKSMRGSDPDASLYWLGRMIEGGEDPLYICRRVIRFASEDVGIADSQALLVAVAAMQAFHFIGQPEGELALAQAVVHLATAPKSNALYTAYNGVRKAIKETGSLPVPLHLRNAPTRLMEELGYAKGYRYPHDFPDAFVEEEYLPKPLTKRRFYRPTDRGYEKDIRERLKRWWKGKKG